MTWQTMSASSEETERIAEYIGTRLHGGEVIELSSDLGGGKTTFTRGLVRGTGSQSVVASPTFTISKVYDAPNFEIHHFDFYRLGDPGIMLTELAELLGDRQTVVVVEWADSVAHVLPDARLSVQIAQQPDGSRNITMSYPEQFRYLTEGLVS